MINWMKKHPFVMCLLFQCILLTLYLLSGTMKYEVSDDFMMQLMVSGAYGTGASDMMFTSPLLAMTLSWLYQTFPFVNWYFYFQASMIMLSLSVISYVFIKEKRHPLLQSLLWALLLFVAKDFYQLMQFTKTATILLCAACILAIYAMKQDKKLLIPAIFFLIVGMMLRLKCIYMAGPALAVYVLFELIEHRHDLLDALKPYILLGLCAVLCYGGVVVSNDYWEVKNDLVAYDAFNHERVAINDVKAVPYEQIKAELDQINITENDYQMLLSWNFGDEAYFDTETMKQVADIMAKHQSHSLKDALYSMIQRQYWTYLIFWFVVVSVGICMLWFHSIPQALMMGATGVLLLLLNAYVSRNVYRVEVSTFVACIIFFFYMLKNPRKMDASKLCYLPALCMLVATLVGMVPVHAQENYDVMNASWDNSLKKYQVSFRQTPLKIVEEMETNPQNTYVLGFQSCIQSFYLHYDPVLDNGASLFQNAIYLGGVDFQHPLRNAWLNQHHIDNTMQALLQDNIYFVEHKTQQQILTFLLEHYDASITMELVKEVDGYQIWKFKQPE